MTPVDLFWYAIYAVLAYYVVGIVMAICFILVWFIYLIIENWRKRKNSDVRRNL